MSSPDERAGADAKSINAILHDRDGGTWIGSFGGLHVFRNGEEAVLKPSESELFQQSANPSRKALRQPAITSTA